MAKRPAFPNKGRRIKGYGTGAAQSFLEGAVVLIAAGLVTEAAADPAAIAGFAAHAAGADPDPTKQLIYMAGEGSTFFIEGDRAPAITDIGVNYGLVKDADGIWIVDTTEVANTRITVEDVDLTRGLYEVTIIPANRQLVV